MPDTHANGSHRPTAELPRGDQVVPRLVRLEERVAGIGERMDRMEARAGERHEEIRADLRSAAEAPSRMAEACVQLTAMILRRDVLLALVALSVVWTAYAAGYTGSVVDGLVDYFVGAADGAEVEPIETAEEL